jgi:hypothetical protein
MSQFTNTFSGLLSGGEFKKTHQAFKNIKQKYCDDLGEKDIRGIKKYVVIYVFLK